MIYIFLFLLFFSFSYGKEIGIKTPDIRNLPWEYRNLFISYFIKNFENVEKYKKNTEYRYILKPNISSVAGNYNLCIDVYEKNRIKKVICFSAGSGEKLSDLLMKKIPEKITFLKPKKSTEIRYIFLKLETYSEKFDKKIRVVSPNGDTIVNYKKVYTKEKKPSVLFKTSVINIDTAVLSSKDAVRLFDLILRGYRIKGILIIKI